jgi:glycosyltransferase involved in cell wall biosynthesis
MTCHLVYSVPANNRSISSRILKRIRQHLNDIGVPIGLNINRQPNLSDLELWPVQSPYENTRNLYLSLSKRVPTKLYHLSERIQCRFHKDDIFIGHPYFPYKQGKYGITEMVVNGRIRPKITALITPLHCDTLTPNPHINKEFLMSVDRLVPRIDILFGIMGQYWWDVWDSSPFAHWKHKMIRLDMAVDANKYPHVKKRFNQPGNRGYLFISASDDPRKGADLFSHLMKELGDFPRGWIGNGPEIPNVARISTNRALTPEFMSNIAEKYDFFVSPAMADPNPTTILESMAWGFPVACTRQSGYYETEYRKNIFLDDISTSIQVLRDLQYEGEDKLANMAKKARKVVESEYTWGRFTENIIKKLGI